MVSINDVAARASVSRQTVSNVLNAPERVRPETRSRVENAIEELGYRPNRTARSLRAQRTRLLGVGLRVSDPDETSTVITRFLQTLTQAAAARHYHILLFPQDPNPVDAHLALHETSTVDGFVLMETVKHDERVAPLAERSIPFAAFGRTEVDIEHDVVDVDSVAGSRVATAHVLGRGRRRPGFIGWPEGSLVGDDRLRGAREACVEAGLAESDLQVVRRSAHSIAGGSDAAGELLDGPTPPDAIVAVSDVFAIGAMRALRARGLVPGKDVAVIGWDDSPAASQVDPPLTSVRQPLSDVAARIVDRIDARFSTPDADPVLELIEPRLVVRDT